MFHVGMKMATLSAGDLGSTPCRLHASSSLRNRPVTSSASPSVSTSKVLVT